MTLVGKFATSPNTKSSASSNNDDVNSSNTAQRKSFATNRRTALNACFSECVTSSILVDCSTSTCSTSSESRSPTSAQRRTISASFSGVRNRKSAKLSPTRHGVAGMYRTKDVMIFLRVALTSTPPNEIRPSVRSRPSRRTKLLASKLLPLPVRPMMTQRANSSKRTDTPFTSRVSRALSHTFVASNTKGLCGNVDPVATSSSNSNICCMNRGTMPSSMAASTPNVIIFGAVFVTPISREKVSA
mmetsp:Transcript_974/g.2971  ORF Transcript_974/g.2971 Transcript_974/m.2971 type:complete len:244 (+) Transcript_974:314-1045(+)